MATTQTKVWSSFLAIMIPPTVNQKLVQILKQNCSPKEPSCLPHITLLDPFLEPSSYDEAVIKLRSSLETFSPFTVTLQEFGVFSKKHGSILWVKPVSQPADALNKLMNVCLAEFPFCDEVTKISSAGYQPHVTLGKFANKDEAPNQCKTLAHNFTGVSFEVKEINFLFKEGKSSYQVRRTVPLGPKRENDIPHFPNVLFSSTTQKDVPESETADD